MPDVKPNTVKACMVRIDELAKLFETLAQAVHDQRSQPVQTFTTSGTSGPLWTVPPSPAEGAQKKAVESARLTTKSVILAEIRAEIAKGGSTARARNLGSIYSMLYGEAT